MPREKGKTSVREDERWPIRKHDWRVQLLVFLAHLHPRLRRWIVGRGWDEYHRYQAFVGVEAEPVNPQKDDR